MHRFLLFLLTFLVVGLGTPAPAAAQATEGLPTRPTPFKFVNDEAGLMSPADAKTLESGLRRYADNTGTQIVVVTVPTLGGRDVADYGRALGEAWGVGQRGKENGIVLLLAGQERKVTIQAGSGLQNVITPELTARVINQQMTPSFKQGNYFAGLRTGLNTLMVTANPDSNPRKDPTAGTTDPGTAVNSTEPGAFSSGMGANTPARVDEPTATAPLGAPVQEESSGPGLGTLLIGAALIGGVLWLLVRMFRRRSQPATNPPYAGNQYPGNQPQSPGPDFLPNRPANNPGGNYGRGQGGAPGPDFLPNRTAGMSGGGMGSGMGTILATGAAAAAGAYLGNRMASGNDSHDTGASGLNNTDANPPGLDPGTAAGAGAATGGGFPAFGGTTDEPAPDYFSADEPGATDAGPDYFSPDDNSSYDDLSSDDTGGGGFDDTDDNSGSW